MSASPQLSRPLNAEEIWASRKKLPFISTFSPKLNAIFGGGFRSTGVYVCSGGPGSYKSSMALDFADASINAGHPVIYVSAELTPQLVIARLMGKKLGMGWLEALDTTDEKKIAETEAVAKQIGSYLWVLDSEQSRDYEKHIKNIYAHFVNNNVEYHKSKGVELTQEQQHVNMLIIIDYIQDLASTCADKFDNQRAAVAHLSRELRGVATGLFVPVLVISSSSRAFYAAAEEQSNATLIGSAKDAGEVEYDSAAVFHLRRRDAGVNDQRLEMVVAKNRFGQSMQTVMFKLDPKSGTITETNETAESFKVEILLSTIAELLYKSPGKYMSAMDIAKELKLQVKDVKKCLEIFGQGTHNGIKLYQGTADGAMKGYILTPPS